MIHATHIFDDDPDAIGWSDDDRKLGLVCPICGESIADDSKLCRRCAPSRRNRAALSVARNQRVRLVRLWKRMQTAHSEAERVRILETVIWPR